MKGKKDNFYKVYYQPTAEEYYFNFRPKKSDIIRVIQYEDFTLDECYINRIKIIYKTT